MGGMTFDGLSSTQRLSTQTSGTTSQATTGTFLNLAAVANYASGTTVSKEFAPVYGGSPISPNQTVMTGTGTASTGSNVWVVFGTPFAATPAVVGLVNTLNSGWLFVSGGTTNAGSFQVIAQTASTTFNWAAAGSGRV